MAGRDVLGKNILLEMKVSDIFYPIFCAKTAEHPIDQDEIETTNVNSGASREYVPGMSNSTISMTGITRVNNGDGRINIVYLMQTAVRRQIHTLRVTLTDQLGNIATLIFDAFIRSTNWSKDASTISNSSVTWRITGDVDLGDAIEPPAEAVCEIQNPLYLDVVAGETSVHSDSLEPVFGFDTTILEVARSGVVFTATTGTPSGNQFRFVSADGDIEFDPLIPFMTGEVIFVLYKTGQSAP